MPVGGYWFKLTNPIKGAMNPFHYSFVRLLCSMLNLLILGFTAFFLVNYDELPLILQFNNSKATYVGLFLASVILFLIGVFIDKKYALNFNKS